MTEKIKNIKIQGTPNSPSVSLDAEEGVIELSGRSIPENPFEFYLPFFQWIEQYGSRPKQKTLVEIKLEYFNTASSKHLLSLLKSLEKISHNGNLVEVNWYFEENDEDMLEAGEDYNALVKLPFKMIKIEVL